jgi:hypothetical protein
VILGQGDCKQSASGAVGPALGGAEAGVDDGGRAVDDGGAAAVEGDRETCPHVTRHTSHVTHHTQPVDSDAVVVLVVPYCNRQPRPLHQVFADLQGMTLNVQDEEEEEEEDSGGGGGAAAPTTWPITGPCPSPPCSSAR